MPTIKSNRAGNSGPEEKFVQLFCDAFGPEKGQYVYTQYPVVDIYGRHRTIDFALKSEEGHIAIEVDGMQWHNPQLVSDDKYHDDLLKQNSLVFDGWRLYRWTDQQIDRAPERVKDELITFLGTSPLFAFIDDKLPSQQGEAFSLHEHQKEALINLAKMRSEHKTIALLYHATGTGKTITAVSDAKRMGKRTLFLAHTKELVYQAYNTFKRHWPEVQVGRYVDGYRESDAYVVCGSIQSIAQHISAFSPEDFGYLIIDECHHGTADTYRKIMSHFSPDFTLGLTATPERVDGEDLLSIFQDVAHKLDLRTAVELDRLVPVRCIRISTNIDLRDVRINGFRYNALDLESRIMLPGRNQLIVDTYCEYLKGKPTVVFCTSINHAQELAALFQMQGINAHSVSGGTNSKDRKRILAQYETNVIPLLCACDLLNEGWDSPHTEALIMARPTMSKTIYMQQLGRGMRIHPGKEFLMVFDFVDNANMFNLPYSLHRLLGTSAYRPGGLVLGKKRSIQWDNDMFARGEKPDVLVDYPVHITDTETIDLFNWQEKAKDMVSQIEFTRRVSAQSETIERYIRDGKLVPDMEVPVSEHRSFKYFYPETVTRYANENKWTIITQTNMKDMFIDMVTTMTMSYSYKPVFILAFLDHMDENGQARLEDVAQEFANFYEKRVDQGLPAEKRPCIFTKGGYSDKDVERLILSMPFKRFEDMGFIRHSKYLGIIQLEKPILRRLGDNERKRLAESCKAALQQYFRE
ncbi:MAG: DEAD/DEAH box helicase family protein [Christensenellales bacterium]